jgi:hypothetical protein
MTKPLLTLGGFIVISNILCAGDTPQAMERLRDSYNAAVNRAVLPLTRTYLDELKKLRDSYTRSSNLEGANAAEAEIQAITQKMTAMGGMGAETEAGKNTVEPGKGTILDTQAKIPANTPDGFKIGPVRRGDHLILTYCSGLWKDHGGIPTENPDSTTDEKDQLVIAAPSRNGLPGPLIKPVPGNTAQRPFVYEVQTDREEIVLRINSNSQVKKNPGEVVYKVLLTR